jgi:rsbT co-antagonist protein RsbR
MNIAKTRLPEILKKYESDLVADWIKEQNNVMSRQGVLKEGELREQTTQFLRVLQETTQKASVEEINTPAWDPVRDLLSTISRSRGLQGFSPAETATFVFSIRRPLFARLRKEVGADAQALADETGLVSELLDKLGLYTTEVYQKAREEVIARQQQELLELSTPVVKLWDGVLALPMIGTLDSARTQIVMEALLQRIVETGCDVAIIDITGVPTVDTLVAQHLLKTVTAARLMGADCIISGIRPQIAQTIVHLGVALGDVVTKATLADALAVAFQRRNLTVVKAKTTPASHTPA